jgi:hypothetical protein
VAIPSTATAAGTTGLLGAAVITSAEGTGKLLQPAAELGHRLFNWIGADSTGPAEGEGSAGVRNDAPVNSSGGLFEKGAEEAPKEALAEPLSPSELEKLNVRQYMKNKYGASPDDRIAYDQAITRISKSKLSPWQFKMSFTYFIFSKYGPDTPIKDISQLWRWAQAENEEAWSRRTDMNRGGHNSSSQS